MKRNWMWMAMAAVVGLALCAPAQDLAAVKQRMLDRKPAVDKLLAAKTVGENRAGCLEAVGKVTDADAKVVEAENADRKTVYAAIAAKNGTSPAPVAQQRAAQISEKAKPGTMLQSADGKWAEKQ